MWVSPPTGHTVRAHTDVTSHRPGVTIPGSGLTRPLVPASADATDGRASDGQSAGHLPCLAPDTSEAFCSSFSLRSSSPSPCQLYTYSGHGVTGRTPGPALLSWPGSDPLSGRHNDRLQNSANAPNKKIRTQFRRPGPAGAGASCVSLCIYLYTTHLTSQETWTWMRMYLDKTFKNRNG